MTSFQQPEGDAAQILSGLAQQQQQQPGFHIPQHQLGPFPGNDPGPSTHPRGPPNLNQISVVHPPQGIPQNPVPGAQRRLRTPPAHRTSGSDGSPGDAGDNAGVEGDGIAPSSPNEAMPGGRTRGGRAAGMSNDEWARQRKDNHVSPESHQNCVIVPCSFHCFFGHVHRYVLVSCLPSRFVPSADSGLRGD